MPSGVCRLTMKLACFCLLAAMSAASAALAQSAGPCCSENPGMGSRARGGGSDAAKVMRETDTMMRDGRYARILQQGRNNAAAFGQALRQQAAPVPTLRRARRAGTSAM
jgi:hypothetical protein